MQIEKFTIGSKSGKLFIADEKANQLNFAPGEAQNLINLINMAASLLEMPVLPPHIASHPFEIHFEETGVCSARRVDTDGSCEFDSGSFDNLIKAIEICLNNFVDSRKLKKTQRGMTSGFSFPDPVIS